MAGVWELGKPWASETSEEGTSSSDVGHRKRRFVRWSLSALFLAALFAVVVAAPSSGSWAAGHEKKNPLYNSSQYSDVADDVARLGLLDWDGTNRGCQPNYYADNPCRAVIPLWREFAARHDLEENRRSADLFEAYIRGDYRMGDRLYAKAKGYELPRYGGYEGPGSEVADLNLFQDRRCPACQEQCSLNPFSDYPCVYAISLWRDFAKRNDLPLDRTSGRIFEAYAQRDFKRGDRLYTSATGRETMLGEEPRSTIGDDPFAFGYGGIDRRCPACQEKCTYNYFADYPCLFAIQPWRDFATKNGLPLDENSAEIYQSYAEGSFAKGDKLFAAAKGITVDELLESTGVAPRKKKKKPSRLLIDIYPMRR